jgi:hypothetical protein
MTGVPKAMRRRASRSIRDLGWNMGRTP